MTELTPEQEALRERARAVAAGIAPGAAETDRSEAYPWHVVARMREAGFFGMTIPRELGGAGLGYMETVLVVEEMAKACAVAGRIAVEANMGAIGAIMAYGTDAQRRLAILREALQELREKTKTDSKTIRAFELLYYHGMSVQAVAADLGMQPQEVYLAKSRVAMRIREIVARIEREYEETPEDWASSSDRPSAAFGG